jgi:arsenite-transporting ATPase
MLRELARVVAVMGKGGVGKTTVAAGLAALALRSGPALLVEFGDGLSGHRALGARSGVDHHVVRTDEALARGARGLFGSALMAKIALDNFAMRPLLRVAPAVAELAMLEAVRQIASENPRARVIVDMPATGHGVAWLRTARQGRDFLGTGPLFDLCDRLSRELVAPGRLSPVVVTLPERLVLEETLELARALEVEVGLRPAALVMNRVPANMGAEAVRDAYALDQSDPRARRLAGLIAGRVVLSEESDAALFAARASGTPVWRVPLRPTDPTLADVVASLAEAA